MSSINFHDKVGVKGNLQIIYMKGEYPVIVGTDILIDPKRTQVLYNDKGHNLVVDEGRMVLNQVMSGDLPGGLESDPITYFCTGEGGYLGKPDSTVDPDPPTGADLDLRHQIFQKEITSKAHLMPWPLPLLQQ